jgi:hypothetical protein
LNEDEKQTLDKTLTNFPTVFGGGFGILNVKPVKLELTGVAKPYNSTPLPVP